jgi:hypothetical protein
LLCSLVIWGEALTVQGQSNFCATSYDTLIDLVPELAALLAFPAYFAVSVTDPAVEPVTVAVQVLVLVEVPLGARTQLALPEIEPEPPVAEMVTVPSGWNPMTVAVHVEAEPLATVVGLQDSVVFETA